MKRYIQINPKDNVVVALESLKAGETITVNGQDILILEDIPVAHKMALSDIKSDGIVVKYGSAIGISVTDIPKGAWVNESNIRTRLDGIMSYSYTPIVLPALEKNRNLSFNGYKRKNGDVGIRNEIWIIPTVGCVNGIVNQLAEAFRTETNCVGVDAIVAYPHNYGCSQLGDDHENTRSVLRNMVHHPNAGAVLVVGLGCENNQLNAFKDFLGDYDAERVRFMETQQVEDEIEVGLSLLRELYHIASKDIRTKVSLSELKVGLKCGGSDAFSGITANPLLGVFSDFLVAQGGTTVLTEVPEMFGAETELMNRCESEQVFNKTVSLINDFKSYFIKNDQPIYENPSPGNKAGGISTLEEKSLGCTQKSGTSAVKDVIGYGECLKIKGLNLLNSPGNDLVASTALASCGCQLVLFTTGRGTPFGTFVPTIKISTNSTLYKNKPLWIDFDAGVILEGKTLMELNEEFIKQIITIANGEPANNEKKNYREIAIFKTGVTL